MRPGCFPNFRDKKRGRETQKKHVAKTLRRVASGILSRFTSRDRDGLAERQGGIQKKPRDA